MGVQLMKGESKTDAQPQRHCSELGYFCFTCQFCCEKNEGEICVFNDSNLQVRVPYLFFVPKANNSRYFVNSIECEPRKRDREKKIKRLNNILFGLMFFFLQLFRSRISVMITLALRCAAKVSLIDRITGFFFYHFGFWLYSPCQFYTSHYKSHRRLSFLC